MKKILTFILIVCLLLSCVACSKNYDLEDNDVTTQTSIQESAAATSNDDGSNTADFDKQSDSNKDANQDAENVDYNPIKKYNETDDKIIEEKSDSGVTNAPSTLQAQPCVYHVADIDEFFYDSISIAAEIAPTDFNDEICAIDDSTSVVDTGNLRDISFSAADNSLYHFFVDLNGDIKMIVAMLPVEEYAEYLITSLSHSHCNIDIDVIADEVSKILPNVINDAENQSIAFENYAIILSPIENYIMLTCVFSEDYQSDSYYETRFNDILTELAMHASLS